MAFVIDNILYVTPATERAYILLEESFSKKDFFVPFSNGEEILDNALRKRWEEVCSK